LNGHIVLLFPFLRFICFFVSLVIFSAM